AQAPTPSSSAMAVEVSSRCVRVVKRTDIIIGQILVTVGRWGVRLQPERTANRHRRVARSDLGAVTRR
ncbi:MAG: hypothetical protein AVDCRST_MAG65-800, partial [uncultured Solirubrobacteraceae bacterium]